MGLENPRQIPPADISGDELAAIFGSATIVGGALWYLGFSVPEIAAAAASTMITARGALLERPFAGRISTEQMRATGRHMMAFGFGSAAAYFGLSHTLPGYFGGGFVGFALAAAPESFRSLFRREITPNQD